MNILIVGCGKVGSRVASELSRMGHDVAVVDRSEKRFAMLDEDFSGLTVCGVPIDQDVLKLAGVESCDALAALTESDNVNIAVSEVAKELFHVPNVLARIYDPRRETVFAHFGLNTVCPTNLTEAAVISTLGLGSAFTFWDALGFGCIFLMLVLLAKPEHPSARAPKPAEART